MKKKPALSFWQIWNVSFGFLGIQIGFALQSANVSRILSSLGADLHSLSFFWLAAPMMGLIVQPIVGAASDRTWNRFGRRGPFLLGGALVASFAMWLMPNSAAVVSIIPALVFGAMMFALMDGSASSALYSADAASVRVTTGSLIKVSDINSGFKLVRGRAGVKPAIQLFAGARLASFFSSEGFNCGNSRSK